MREPRFYVGSVSGWAITDGNLRKGPTRPGGKDSLPVCFYVHDRANCHHVVAAFRAPDGLGARAGRLHLRAHRERAAHERAAELNARYEAWLCEDVRRLRDARWARF